MATITIEYPDELQPLLYDTFWALYGDKEVQAPSQEEKLINCLFALREIVLTEVGKYQRESTLLPAIGGAVAAEADLKTLARTAIKMRKAGVELVIPEHRHVTAREFVRPRVTSP